MLYRKKLLLPFLLLACLVQPAHAAGPAAGSALVCTPGKFRTVQLLFGMSGKDGRGVSEQQWESFLAAEVDPRFTGATVTEAAGRYLDKQANKLYLEKAKVVTLVVPCTQAADRDIDDVIQTYIRRFDQDSVGKVELGPTILEEKDPSWTSPRIGTSRK
ncbi:MAG TPA: DUF3574 domain-containing protein [Geomonas sp.]|nr:DUF3574 domain-containing protein [Geomonas sp.]